MAQVMNNSNEAWREDNFYLKDNEKFQVISRVYEDIFISKAHFIELTGISRANVYNWFQKNTQCSFNTKSKIKICKAFALIDKVWKENFSTSEEFEKSLPDYQKIEKKSNNRDIEKHILIQLVTREENGMSIENLSKEETTELLQNRLEKESSSFMFSFSQKLKDEDRIEEALNVLAWIDERESTFKYKHENELRYLKAILLSHEHVKNWNGAIHILRSLYHSRHYHLEKPEILTLLASNYKRKALDGCTTKEEIDMELITSALCIYEDAYTLKPDEEKYYDAINLTYLYAIVDAVEIEYADKIEIETLYKDLSLIVKENRGDWWRVSSKAEFLMLLGKVESAIVEINYFLENYNVKPFEIETTIRQIKLYIQLTHDKNAKDFLEYLEECWVNINV